MYVVSVYKGDKPVREESIASKNVISIGRHQLNDICLSDPSCKISRFHAVFFFDMKEGYFLQDMGSRNSTYVNGRKKDYGKIIESDKIMIGDYSLMIRNQTDNKAKNNRVTIIEENNEENINTIYSPVSFKIEGIKPFANDPESLLLLYQISRYANFSSDVQESLQLIIEELFNKFCPDRIFVAFLEQGGEGMTCEAKYPKDSGEINVSSTMISYLLDEKRAFVTKDALTDKRFKQSGRTAKSVMDLKVRSAITVPLKWGGEIRGLLYLDSSEIKGHFDENDTAFLTLVCNDISSLMERSIDYSIVKDENDRLERKLSSQNTIVGISSKTRDILKLIGRFSKTDASILITGETGTGKDLAAKAVHQDSKRKKEHFIEVNCAAIPDNLLETELFGVIANYPGLHNKEALKGKFQLADGGTIFLDEIGELPLKLQAKLLVVLEEKRIWPLGAKEPVIVDIRIIAATNRDIQKEIENGNFREDLYERLNILRIHMPPLKERKEDIPLLANFFLHQLRQTYGRRISRFSSACIQLLYDSEWPRNIRELRNAIERAIIISDKPVITPALFKLGNNIRYRLKTLAEMEKAHIVKVLGDTMGNKEKAIRILGISRQTLYNKGKEYKIPGFEQKKSV